MLLFMTTAFGSATWNTMHDLAIPIKTIPAVLFVVVCILVARLYAKVDEIMAVQPAVECAVEPVSAQVPLETHNEIWNHWDKNGTGRPEIESASHTYGMPANVVQHLLEQYDARWREQVAMLYRDNPLNEYTAHTGIDKNEVAKDALRLASGLPIYPVAGVWLCSACRKRPCHCDVVTSK